MPSLELTLTRIAEVAQKVQTVMELDAAICGMRGVSASYTTALEHFRHGQTALAMANLSVTSPFRNQFRATVQTCLWQTIAIVSLVYLAFLLVINVNTQLLTGIVRQLRLEPGPALRVFAFLQSVVFLWGPLVPIALIALAQLLRMRRFSDWSDLLPASRRGLKELSCVSVASGLPKMQSQIDLPVGSSAEVYTSRFTMAQRSPLLSLGIESNQGDGESLSLRQSVMNVLQRSARLRFSKLNEWTPLYTTVLVGGIAVLFLGFALFAPLIETLTLIIMAHFAGKY